MNNAHQLLLVIVVAATFMLTPLVSTHAQEEGAILGHDESQPAEDNLVIQPVRTDSPQDTLATFLQLRDELETTLLDYSRNRTSEGVEQIQLLFERLRALLDLDAVASASRRETGNDTVAYLLDIFGRIDLPKTQNVPDVDAFEDEGFAQYRIPKTPLRITRITEGDREGEFLFNGRTVRVAPRYFQSIKDLPLQTELGIQSWARSIPQLTGPIVPAAFVQALPTSLRTLWLDTPRWKVGAIVLIAIAAIALLAACIVGWRSGNPILELVH